MAKDLPWFKWNPSKWHTGNIQMCSHSSKGVFTDLCALYWSRLGELPYALALQSICKGDASAFKELLTYHIFRLEDDSVRIDFLDEQLAEFDQASEKRRKAANKRWSTPKTVQASDPPQKDDASAYAMHMQSNAIKRREEETRQEENREEEIPTDFEKEIFGDELFLGELRRLFPAIDLKIAWYECSLHFKQQPRPPSETWQWRQKFQTWLSIKQKNVNGKFTKTIEPARPKNSDDERKPFGTL